VFFFFFLGEYLDFVLPSELECGRVYTI